MKILLAGEYLLFRGEMHPIPSQVQVLARRIAVRACMRPESGGTSHG